MIRFLAILITGFCFLNNSLVAKESWELKDREWVALGGNEKIKLIVDNKSILKEDENNNNLSVALISIFSEPYWDERIAGQNINNKIALSHVTKWEINCTDKKLRIILQNWFDKKMPNGFIKDAELVYLSLKSTDWINNPPDGTIPKILMSHTCYTYEKIKEKSKDFEIKKDIKNPFEGMSPEEIQKLLEKAE